MGKGCRWAALTVATLGVKTVTAPVAARALTVDHLSDLSGLRLARWGLVSNPVRDFVLIRVCLWCVWLWPMCGGLIERCLVWSAAPHGLP